MHSNSQRKARLAHVLKSSVFKISVKTKLKALKAVKDFGEVV
jgi:hypothetical protein